MAETDGQIQLEIVLDDGSVRQGFAKVKQEGKKAGADLGKGFSAGFTGAIAAVGAAVGSAVFFRKIIKEATDAERVTKQLNFAFASIGKFTQEAAADFDRYALSLTKVTGIDDDLIKSNAALLIQLGRLSGTELKRATQASLDLGAALGISTQSAFQLVAKAATGATESLGRYGIILDKNIPRSEKFGAVLKLIEERFAGSASAAANTFEVAFSRLEIATNSVFEAFGNVITKSPTVVAVLQKLGDIFFSLSESLANERDLLRGPIEGLLLFAQAVTNFVVAPLEVALNVISFGISRLAQFIFNIQNTGAALTVFAANVATTVTTIVGNVIADVVSVFSTTAAEKIRQQTDNLVASLAPSEETRAAANTIFSDFGAELADSFNTPLSDGLAKGIAELQTAVAQAKPVTDQLKNQTLQASQEAARNVGNIAQTFQTGVVAVISAGVQRIGAALNEGGSAFNGFLAQVAGILGDLAINIGQTLLGIGLGIDQLKAALFTLSGGLAIVAGLGLIALGGLLKSLSTGSIASAATGSTAPSTVAAPITDVAGGIEAIGQEAERQAPGTEVVVNIQGDVLDSDETGIRIVDVLNQAFDKKGVSLRRGLA